MAIRQIKLVPAFVALLALGLPIGVPRLAVAAHLSGTIRYTGAKGPVSDARPILLFLNRDAFFNDFEAAKAGVTVNGDAFDMEVRKPGNYYLAYFLDVDGNGNADAGEPFGVFQNRLNFPGDPVAAPQSGLSVEFGDSATISSFTISGTATYTGDRGPVSQDRPIIIRQSGGGADVEVTANGGRVEVHVGVPSSLQLWAFLDANGDRNYDPGEPYTIYRNRGTPPSDPLVPGQTDVDLVFGDGDASLSGTVSYSGSLGPVSPARPLRLYLFTVPSPADLAFDSNANADDHLAQLGSVTTNGGSFDLRMPVPDTYFLVYGLDTNGDTALSAGEPYAIYNNRSAFPADPLAAPQSGLSLYLDDAWRISGISGIVAYTGSLSGAGVIVQSFVDENLSRQYDDYFPGYSSCSQGCGYILNTLDTETYWLRAFFDVNGNFEFDPGEPYEIYSHKGAPPADPVVAGAAQSAINFAFGDENAGPSPTPIPTATPTATPAGGGCVGNCNGDTQVTVDELLTMVNIALGNADVSTCMAGDANHDGQITINEILTAVNNALNGCGG